MKINLENMKGLAEKLDYLKPPPFEEIGVTDEDVCNMAYQLQYFFEALEKIKVKSEFWQDAHFKDDRARYEAYQDALTTLNKAVIDKVDA